MQRFPILIGQLKLIKTNQLHDHNDECSHKSKQCSLQLMESVDSFVLLRITPEIIIVQASNDELY